MTEIVTKNPPLKTEEVVSLLKEFDEEFIPCLSQRTDLPAYAARLAERAVWIFAYEQGAIIGHCAAYMNQKDCAFISSIAVKHTMRGQGIGSLLLKRTQEEALARGMTRIALKAYDKNEAGIRFYERHGCRVSAREGEWLTMCKEIESEFVNRQVREGTKMAKNERFIKVYSQGTMNVMEIWMDRETGVNYVFHAGGYAGGMTPLLDKDGKPVIAPIVNK